MFSRLLFVPLLVGLAITTPAQTVPIHTGVGNFTVSSMSSWRRNLAVAPDGRLFSLIYETDGTTRSLLLFASSDFGQTWARVADTPTKGDSAGALVFGTDCDVCHVGWSARGTGSYFDAYYQAFDVRTMQWVGSPTLLVAGSNSNDQYYVNDVEVTAKGTVVVVISTHRGPPSGTWSGGWATGLFVRRAGTMSFLGPFQVNTDTYGVRPDAQAIGETVHMSFRTNTGLYGIRYRAYDTEAMAFVTPLDIPLLGANQGTMKASNVNQIAADGLGNLYVLYSTGGSSVGTGKVELAYSTGNHATWTTQTVTQDTDLLGGNNSYYHYSLATSGDSVLAIYSKRTNDQHKTLYVQAFNQGVQTIPESPLIQTNDANRFAQVAGVRNTQSVLDAMAVVENRSTSFPGRQVEFVSFGSAGLTTRFGVSCQGSLAQAPRLYTTSPASSGATFPVVLENLVPNLGGAVLVGNQCLATAIPLDPFGMPGCSLVQDAPITISIPGTASGAYTLLLPIPSSPTFAGLPFLFQGVAFAPGANPLGVVVTNNLMVRFR